MRTVCGSDVIAEGKVGPRQALSLEEAAIRVPSDQIVEPATHLLEDRKLCRLLSGNISLAGSSKKPSGSFIGLAPVCSVRLFRAAIKVGALLNSERLMMNIANDMRLRFENYLAALDRPLNLTVHDHALSNDTSDDLRLRRDNE